MAIAPLGFSVDTSQVAKATGDLGKLTAATGAANAAVNELGRDSTAAASGVAKTGAAAAAAAAQNDNLAASTRAANQQMRNLAFQFQDIGTMLAAGQSPFMLLAQQLPQITMYGGRLNGVVGALKTTFAGLLSPLGLVTTGFVLAASAAISFFSDASEDGEKVKEQLEDQVGLIRRVADEWGDAVPAVASYADELERVIELEELRAATAATIGREFEAGMDALRNFELNLDELGEWDEAAQQLVADIGQLSRAANELEEIQKEGGDTTEAFAEMQRLVSSIINSTAVPATGSLRDRVNELARAYENATGRAQEAAQAAADLEARGGVGRNDRAGAGRGGDPRGSFEDEGGYWSDTYFPDPERPTRTPRTRTRTPRKTEAQRAAENYAEMIRSSQQFIQQQQLEAQVLGMTEEAANALRYEQELLNQAANDNIKLTPQMASELSNYARQMAAAEAATARLQEQLDFVDDTARGFINDLSQGLRDGEGVWESFSNAAINALDRIMQKLIEMATDELIANLLGSLVGSIGGGGFSPTTNGFATMLGMAKGGVFSGGNVVPFARGGIVNGPTLFPMAKGAGLMGEAGPEGIMPLRRDSQGNLGVIASGGGGEQRVAVDIGVSVDNNGNLQAYVQRTAQQATTEGIRQYDRTGPARLPRDAKQVRARMGAA